MLRKRICSWWGFAIRKKFYLLPHLLYCKQTPWKIKYQRWNFFHTSTRGNSMLLVRAPLLEEATYTQLQFIQDMFILCCCCIMHIIILQVVVWNSETRWGLFSRNLVKRESFCTIAKEKVSKTVKLCENIWNSYCVKKVDFMIP